MKFVGLTYTFNFHNAYKVKLKETVISWLQAAIAWLTAKRYKFFSRYDSSIAP
jgi:hypothetical protein